MRSLYRRGLVGGRVYAVDGSGLSTDLRRVCLVNVGAERPFVVAWRC